MREFDTANRILIGKSGADHVTLEITEPLNQDSWLEGNLDVRVGPWSGTIRVLFYQGELNRFASQIERLYSDLVGPAELHPMEPYLELRLCGNGRGAIILKGEAQDSPSSGTYLVFRLEMDQTELPAIATWLRTADPV
ncbi:MAG: hypothetical protein HYX25_05555 [Candidatus Solibacter usitatus]|nr:hypothetical protein [Candidatus Solibacter usitatus]